VLETLYKVYCGPRPLCGPGSLDGSAGTASRKGKKGRT